MTLEGNISSGIGGKLLAWVLVGAGTVLAYSAVRNRAPWDVLRDLEGAPLQAVASTATTGVGPSGFGGGLSSGSSSGGSFSASVPRIRQIANRELPPDLVPIKPSGKLDRDAAASLARISQRLGYDVPNVGSYRSFAEQAAGAASGQTMSDGKPRFASPNKSLHVVGLAIDVRADYAAKQEVIDAFTAEGWQRARAAAEPWHWSYLVRG